VTRSPKTYDAAIIGGGLSGICAALTLGRMGVNTALLDRPINNTGYGMGGFARFSGAKFSLPPAGMGLLPILGSYEDLSRTITQVLKLLDLEHKTIQNSLDSNLPLLDKTLSDVVKVRNYDSIVLTPAEMATLTTSLSEQVHACCSVSEGECLGIVERKGRWEVAYRPISSSSSVSLAANVVFFAGGRTGSPLLLDAGCRETGGKGIDLGVRVEFTDREDLRCLRALGPDAKLLSGKCRTFCLNVPGKIHHYEYESISIPGGIVADSSHEAANVGILYRHPNKAMMLDSVLRNSKRFLTAGRSAHLTTEGFLGQSRELTSQILGTEVTNALCSFSLELQDLGFVDWSKPHYVHLPLLDWHWDTFSLPSTFRSTVDGLYVLGDSSGHARGLLQAAASGYIAAREFMQ